jgi:hypothetical protein
MNDATLGLPCQQLGVEHGANAGASRGSAQVLGAPHDDNVEPR